VATGRRGLYGQRIYPGCRSQARFVGGRDGLYQQAAYGAERIDNGPLGNA
jgi:hypothetical protein